MASLVSQKATTCWRVLSPKMRNAIINGNQAIVSPWMKASRSNPYTWKVKNFTETVDKSETVAQRKVYDRLDVLVKPIVLLNAAKNMLDKVNRTILLAFHESQDWPFEWKMVMRNTRQVGINFVPNSLA